MGSPRDPLVALEEVSVRFPVRGSGSGRATVQAVTDASLDVGIGETVGVVGESGCGKSTLAKVLVGLQKPSEGSVRFGGRDVWRMNAGDRRRLVSGDIGMIFQDPSSSLNRRMPVRTILRDPLDVHRWKQAADRNERVREVLELVGLPASVSDALPSQLSGGQRQRVAIGRALALSPRILVADEPTSALDVSVRAQILNLLLDLKERLGLAMVYVSHDIQAVRWVCDRVLTMYLGRIVEETPAAAVAERTRHPYSRALLSATPSLRHSVTPIPLTGAVPSAVHPPSGCPFRTRCWRATSACASHMPAITADPSDAGHRFRCHHPILTAADLAAAASQELT